MAATFYNQSHVTYEDDTAGVKSAGVMTVLASVVAHVGEAFSRQLYDTCVDEQCFALPQLRLRGRVALEWSLLKVWG